MITTTGVGSVSWEQGSTTLKSNAFIHVPEIPKAMVFYEGPDSHQVTYPNGVVFLKPGSGASFTADYKGFFNTATARNYSDQRSPANDLNGGAKTDPKFAGPLPTTTTYVDLVAVWQRRLSVGDILRDYHARYTPTTGSKYIDAGDPAYGPGNDIGAIGAGTPNTWDKFGIFGDLGPGPKPQPDPEEPSRTITRYLAEGSTSNFFDTTIDLANPDATRDAHVLLRFLRSDGAVVPRT